MNIQMLQFERSGNVALQHRMPRPTTLAPPEKSVLQIKKENATLKKWQEEDRLRILQAKKENELLKRQHVALL